MKLVFVMDGTVPVLCAKLLVEDGWDEVMEDRYTELVRVIDVDISEMAVQGGQTDTFWVAVDINENGGIDVVIPYFTIIGAIAQLAKWCEVEMDQVDTVLEGKHYVAVANADQDNESYAHAFLVSA
jgi:hypothetical protein